MDKSPFKELNSLIPSSLQKKKDFAKKTVWIIGASSGIGERIALNLCSIKEGAPKRIIISARRINELNRVANKCNCINPMIEVIIKPLDITDFSQNGADFADAYVANIFDEIDDDIDICVLNSGMIQKCRSEYASTASFKQLAEINMFGPMAMAQSMIRQWRFRGYTKNKTKVHQIAVTSSFCGKIGSPGYAFYSATKHALNGFFESLRIEVQDDNIDTNIMCLGPIMPSKETHAEVGGRENVKYVRNYTDKYGNVMEADRCAQLYCTALRYSLSEPWITCNPYLFYMYSRQYIPFIAIPLVKVFGKPFVREVQRSDKM